MKKLILLILSLSCATAFTDPQHTTRNLTRCVIRIVEELKATSLNELHLDLTVMNMNNNLDLYVLHNLKGIRFISRTFLSNLNGVYNVAYLIMSEDYEELKHGLSKVTEDFFWNPTAKFIIILQNLEENNVSRIRKLLHKLNIFDIKLILFQNKDYAIYMFNSTENNSCNKRDRLVFTSWCSEYRDKYSLPNLVRNISLSGCRFKFIANNLWPYINLDGTSMEGVEQRMLRLFEERQKVKIELVAFSRLNRFGDINEDYFLRMIRKVEKDEFEGAVGGFHVYSERFGNLSYTYPLMLDKKVYIVPRAQTLGMWEALLRSSLYTCILVGFIFVFFCIAAILLSIFSSQKRNISRDSLIVLGCILNKTSIKNINSNLPQRLTAACLFFFALIIPYIVQAYLFTVCSYPVRGFEPKTLNDMKGYKLTLNSAFLKDDTVDSERKCGNRLSCLLEVRNSKDKLYTIMTSSSYETYRSILADENCFLGVYPLKEPYKLVLRTILLRRGSILLYQFNDFIFRIESSGLINKFISDLEYEDRMQCKSNHQRKHNPLKIRDIYGAFVIVIGGSCLSVLVFICELLVARGHLLQVYKHIFK